MNEDEMMSMLSGTNSVETLAEKFISRMNAKSKFGKDVVDSYYASKYDIGNYTKQKDAYNVCLRKDVTDYDVGTYSNADSEGRIRGETRETVPDRLHELSEEAYRIIDDEASSRGVSMIDVILEKARDRVIQPDILDELGTESYRR